MKKFFVYIIGVVVVSMFSLSFAKEEVKSTEGLKLEQTISKTKDSKSEEKNYKTKRKEKQKYLKNVSNIKKMRNKKRIKERNLEFYNKRLELKKQRLEELSSEIDSIKEGE